MKRLALPFLLSFCLASSASGASPDPKDLTIPPADMSRAKLLVGQLASEEFAEREDAQDELAKMGRLAFPALLEGLNTNPSPEVRFRCQALIPKSAHADLQARLATFLADVDGKFEHDMPGWNEFRKLAGGNVASRSTFVELLKEPANRALVLGVAGSPHELGRLISTRKQDIYQMRFPRTSTAPRKEQTIADIIALMFAESHVESKHVPRSVGSVTTIYNIAGLSSALTDGSDKAAVYKAVVGSWIETRDDALSMYQAMTQATTLGLKEQSITVAARLLQMKGGIATYRMYAAFALARDGDKKHLPVLESAFSDEAALNAARVVNGVVERQSVQVRDMALVSALLITGQNTEEYGFTEQYKNQANMQYTYSNWRLPDDKRKAAFEKWKAWREKNKDFGKEKK